jgi:hypothetical protein
MDRTTPHQMPEPGNTRPRQPPNRVFRGPAPMNRRTFLKHRPGCASSMKIPRLAALLVAIAVLGLPQMGASLTANTPQNLRASYDGATRTVGLAWTPHNSGNGFTYLVWRDGSMQVGNTSALGFAEQPSASVPPAGLVYFVSSQSPSGAVSFPAVVGVTTISCEVVTVSTSWQAPFLYAHLHQECVGGITQDKDVTWTAPQ